MLLLQELRKDVIVLLYMRATKFLLIIKLESLAQFGYESIVRKICSGSLLRDLSAQILNIRTERINSILFAYECKFGGH